MALTNEIISQWHQGLWALSVHASTLKAGQKIFKGGLGMHVNGVARKPVTGTDMAALCLTVAGADANGGVILSSRQPNVRVIFLGGTSKSLAVTVTFGATIDVYVQQATDNAAAVTSSASQTCDAIRAHGTVSRLLRCKPTGNGSGLTALQTAVAVPHIALLGAAVDTYDAAALGSDLAFSMPDMEFRRGIMALVGAANDAPAQAQVDLRVAIADENTCKKTMDPLDLTVPFVFIETGKVFADLSRAE